MLPGLLGPEDDITAFFSRAAPRAEPRAIVPPETVMQTAAPSHTPVVTRMQTQRQPAVDQRKLPPYLRGHPRFRQ